MLRTDMSSRASTSRGFVRLGTLWRWVRSIPGKGPMNWSIWTSVRLRRVVGPSRIWSHGLRNGLIFLLLWVGEYHRSRMRPGCWTPGRTRSRSTRPRCFVRRSFRGLPRAMAPSLLSWRLTRGRSLLVRSLRQAQRPSSLRSLSLPKRLLDPKNHSGK